MATNINVVQSGRIGENGLLSDNPILSCVQYSTERNCLVPKILFCDVFFRGKYLTVAASITCNIVVLHEYCIANMAPMLQITRRTSLFFSSSLSLAGITNEGLHNLTLRWYSHNLTLRWYSHNLTLRWYSYCYTVPKSLFSVLSPWNLRKLFLFFSLNIVLYILVHWSDWNSLRDKRVFLVPKQRTGNMSLQLLKLGAYQQTPCLFFFFIIQGLTVMCLLPNRFFM